MAGNGNAPENIQLLDQFHKVNEILSYSLIFVVLGLILVVVVKEYFKTTEAYKKLRRKYFREGMLFAPTDVVSDPAKYLRDLAKNSSNDPSLNYQSTETVRINNSTENFQKKLQSTNTVGANFQLLEKYYEQHLIEYKLMSRSSLIVSIVGFMAIILGIYFAASDHASIGFVTSSAGLISEVTAALFFKQNKLLIAQILEYHKKLISTQYLLTTISLANELPESRAIQEKERIIGNLLFLSNELHGVTSSNHLFTGQK